MGATVSRTSETPFFGPDFASLCRDDPEVADVVLGELERQRGGLQLIAGENFASPAVLAALGSTLTNKYAEGYPGRRHHAGCAGVDRVEEIGIRRAKELFGAGHANLQPCSGTLANLAAYTAVLRPGDTLLAMAPSHGGHLTHGSRANASGRWFDVVPYGVRETDERIDTDRVRELAHAHRPKLIVCGATSYSRLIDFAFFRRVADEVGALLMVDAAQLIGLVAGGAVPSPVPYADLVTCTTHKVLRGPRGGMILCRPELAARVDAAVFPFLQGAPPMHVVAAKAVALGEAATPGFAAYTRRVVANCRALAEGLAAEGMRPVTGGTDTHLAVLDVRRLGVSGREAEHRCERAGIALNRTVIPFDPARPRLASGIRVGTAAVTAQGMTDGAMKEIAALLARAVRCDGGGDAEGITRGIRELLRAHPAYPMV